MSFETDSKARAMQRARLWIREHRHFAAALVILALFVRIAIPSGYMLSKAPDLLVTVSICADATGGLKQMQLAIPVKPQDDSHSEARKMDGPCAFAGLSDAALGGADAFLLALAFAFILVLGLRPAAGLQLAQFAFLRPPLRGPPMAA